MPRLGGFKSQLLCLQDLHYYDKLFRYAVPTEVCKPVSGMQILRERSSPNVLLSNS